jgi:hypothetical protein
MPYTVVVTSFNSAETIELVIKGVKELVPPPSQVILIDDASNDGSAPDAMSVRRGASYVAGMAGMFYIAPASCCPWQLAWLRRHLQSRFPSR